MDRIATTRMVNGHREVVVFCALAVILTTRSSRLVIDIKTRRGRDILRVHDIEILLTETFLTRLDIVQTRHGPFHVVEGNILEVIGVGVVGLRKGEVEIGRTTEIVDRQRRLTQGTLRDIAHILQIEGIVDAEILQRRILAHQLHAIEPITDVVTEIGQGSHRIIEEVGFERFFDALLLLGRILLFSPFSPLFALGLLKGIRAVEVRTLAIALCTIQVTCIEVLGNSHAATHPTQAAQKRDADRKPLRHTHFVSNKKFAAKIGIILQISNYSSFLRAHTSARPIERST